MSRLVRLLSAATPVHAFGRLRASRAFRSCRDQFEPSEAASPTVATEPSRFAMPAPNKRTASVRPVPVGASAVTRGTVRVYRGSTGMTMVGKIDAICRMIDRAIADEHAAMLKPGSDIGTAS